MRGQTLETLLYFMIISAPLSYVRLNCDDDDVDGGDNDKKYDKEGRKKHRLKKMTRTKKLRITDRNSDEGENDVVNYYQIRIILCG